MRVGRKGLGTTGMVSVIVIAVIILSVLSHYTWGEGSEGFPTTPEEYSLAWQEYGAIVLGENQPWAILALFFFPLLIYFSAFYFSLSLGLLAVSSRARINYNEAQKPLTVFCLAISFLMLPGPATAWIYSIVPVLGLSPIAMIGALIVGSLIMLVAGAKVIGDMSPGGGTGGGPRMPDVSRWQDRYGDIRDRVSRAMEPGRSMSDALADVRAARRRINHLRNDVEAAIAARPELADEGNRIINALNDLETNLQGVEQMLRDARTEEETERARQLLNGIEQSILEMNTALVAFFERAAEPVAPSPEPVSPTPTPVSPTPTPGPPGLPVLPLTPQQLNQIENDVDEFATIMTRHINVLRNNLEEP